MSRSAESSVAVPVARELGGAGARPPLAIQPPAVGDPAEEPDAAVSRRVGTESLQRRPLRTTRDRAAEPVPGIVTSQRPEGGSSQAAVQLQPAGQSDGRDAAPAGSPAGPPPTDVVGLVSADPIAPTPSLRPAAGSVDAPASMLPGVAPNVARTSAPNVARTSAPGFGDVPAESASPDAPAMPVQTLHRSAVDQPPDDATGPTSTGPPAVHGPFVSRQATTAAPRSPAASTVPRTAATADAPQPRDAAAAEGTSAPIVARSAAVTAFDGVRRATSDVTPGTPAEVRPLVGRTPTLLRDTGGPARPAGDYASPSPDPGASAGAGVWAIPAGPLSTGSTPPAGTGSGRPAAGEPPTVARSTALTGLRAAPVTQAVPRTTAAGTNPREAPAFTLHHAPREAVPDPVGERRGRRRGSESRHAVPAREAVPRHRSRGRGRRDARRLPGSAG